MSLEQIVNLNVTGIKYESWDKFDDSFFKNNYISAYQMVNDIINRNNALVEKYGTTKRYDEFSNIITFAGKRGSGKTSVMLSFLESLKEYDKTVEEREKHPRYKLKENRLTFTCLDCLDGSLLEKGEDIFQLVLAQMYQKYQNLYEKRELTSSESGYQSRELMKQFRDLYGITKELNALEQEDSASGESYISDLRTLASSQKLKENFQKMVQEYLSLMNYRYAERSLNSKQHFLVITIDDIDLNIEYGFSMLEKIHRYLMGPNIIVLLSLDFDQILKISMNQFYDMLPKVDHLLRKGKDYIQKISTDYLDKVLPINYRIYLPDMGNKMTSCQIMMGDSSSVLEMENQRVRQDTPKNLLLSTIYRKSYVAFDSQGLRLHLYETQSLRELSQFLMKLNQMKDLELQKCEEDIEKTGEVFGNFAMNFQDIFYDLITRMAKAKIIDEDDRALFERATRQDVRRAMEIVILYGREKLREKNYSESEDITIGRVYRTGTGWLQEETRKLPQDDEYGNLIYILYQLSRHERYEMLAQCLIAYFSYAFTRIYLYEYKYKRNGEELMDSPIEKGTFRAAISGSLVGILAGEMLPQINYKVKRDETVGEGIRLRKNVISYAYRIKDKEVDSFHNWFDMEWFEGVKRDRVSLQARIVDLEILFLSLSFLKNVGMEGEKWNVTIKERGLKPQSSELAESLIVSILNENGQEITNLKGQFNIFNFVENSMLEERLGLKNFEDALLKAVNRQFNRKISNKSLLAVQYEIWRIKYDNTPALPVYWFDMMYNIIKRAWKIAQKENPAEMEQHELFYYISKVYKNISSQLKSQEKFYQDALGQTELWKLQEIFEECPYVNYFLTEDTAEIEHRAAFFEKIANRLIQKAEE